MQIPSMEKSKWNLLKEILVDSNFIIGIYEGSLSDYDFVLKYRQKTLYGEWSHIRTPKHIHWAVDILIKRHFDNNTTNNLLKWLISRWDKQIHPITSKQQRNELFSNNILLNSAKRVAKHFSDLNGKGEYSIVFLILMAKLLMIQEKTNNHNAFMFRKVLVSLKEGKDIFQTVSTATHNGR